MVIANNTILLSIDVEDWFQVENLRPWFPHSQWETQPTRVEDNTRRLLNLFDSFNNPIRATFFILGWIARKHPKLVKLIEKHGHEVASHGNDHNLCSTMERRTLQRDLIDSKHLLEDLIGQEVVGFRAPSFSISDDVVKLVQDSGYKYDSSYNSFEKHGRYGRLTPKVAGNNGIAIPWAPGFYELPISNLKMAGHIIPWGGGGYFRFIPSSIFRAGVRYILKNQGTYLFYMHPWEIDAGQPKIRSKGLNIWRHYLHLDKTYSRLFTFISRFESCRFISCRSYLGLQVKDSSDLNDGG